MKKLRVVVRTVISHQIYVERDGERTLYAVTDTVKKARALVMKAKRELGIARASSEGQLKSIQRSSPSRLGTTLTYRHCFFELSLSRNASDCPRGRWSIYPGPAAVG